MAGATQTAQDHASAQTANQEFLTWASTVAKPSILGSIASGATGGPAFPVVWSRVLPVVPRWIESIDLFVSLPYTLSIPAGATVSVSPFFPYSAVQQRLTIAGSPPWDYVSLVPHWLDEITRRTGFDPTSSPVFAQMSAGFTPGYTVPSGQTDPGGAGAQAQTTFVFNTGNASIIPGQTIHNAGTAAQVLTGTLTFSGRIILQRRPATMFGMIPNGDPQDRPDLEIYLSPLVGPQPENSLIQDFANAGATMSLTGTGTVYAVWNSKGLDVLPPGVAPTEPTVGLGWAINAFTTPVPNAGQIFNINHQAAILYQKIFHLVYTNQKVQDCDYFGLWVTGEQQNARWEFDAAQNNMFSYWKKIITTYGRFMPAGTFIADFVSGVYPEEPADTPYNGAMSPDQSYASAFGIKYTPAMATALRYPTGTGMTNATVRTYSMGYVEVPY